MPALEFEEKRLTPQPAVVIRATARPDALGPVMGELLPAVSAYVEQSAVQSAGPLFARYLSMEGEEWEFECGMAVTAPVAGEGRIEPIELPGGDAITTIHTGSYETLGQSWEALYSWVAEHGKQPAETSWELYLTDPGEIPNPAEWRTELVQPLASRES